VRIAGASILLTGATGGIGQAIARELSAAGATLILTGRREDVLQPLAAELGARAMVVDLNERGELRQLAGDAADTDILIANAGIPAAGRLESFTPEEVDRTLDVNLRAPVMLAHALLEGMLARRRGHLVFISSIAGKMTVPGNPLYHATKFGLRGFAGGLRADLHGSGVGVSCIFLGFIREAGIFADSGVKLPPGVGTRSPHDVARAVAGAIEHDRGEVDVASFSQRAGAVAGALAPEVSARFIRRMGGVEIASEMERSLRDRR
jgi:uncharacterized protein